MAHRPCLHVFVLPLLMAACASGGPGDPGSGIPDIAGTDVPIIEIMNGAWNADDVQILIVSSLGIQKELGSAEAGDTVVFTFGGEPGTYGLHAVDTRGARRRSRTFTMGRDTHIRWDLQTGFLTSRRRQD